jgi:hypothetical protein
MWRPISSKAAKRNSIGSAWITHLTAVVCCTLSFTAGINIPTALALELPAYDDNFLAEWQQRYPPGILSNFNQVILPRIDAAERQALQGVGFRFPLRIDDREPFAFAADAQNRTIYMSVQSLKFLDEISIAIAWLDRNGYSTESVYNYLTMVKNWQASEPPPPILPTLCIPENVLSNPDVDSLAQKSFSTAVVFIMLHELGHIFHGHSGYVGVDPTVARENESEADTYALNVMARLGDVPLGVVNLFLTMAYLFESRTDFSSDQDHELRLAARTHPLSAERLRRFADALQATAGAYSGRGLTQVEIIAITGQIRIVAQNFLDIQRLTALIGQSIKPVDLGPVRMGEKLGRRCGGNNGIDGPFSGKFRGSITINNVEFDVDAEMLRTGGKVRGRSSYGIGVSEFEGIIEDDALHYRWRLGADNGRGILVRNGENYEGTWGNAESNSDGGVMRLTSN